MGDFEVSTVGEHVIHVVANPKMVHFKKDKINGPLRVLNSGQAKPYLFVNICDGIRMI